MRESRVGKTLERGDVDELVRAALNEGAYAKAFELMMGEVNRLNMRLLARKAPEIESLEARLGDTNEEIKFLKDRVARLEKKNRIQFQV